MKGATLNRVIKNSINGSHEHAKTQHKDEDCRNIKIDRDSQWRDLNTAID